VALPTWPEVGSTALIVQDFPAAKFKEYVPSLFEIVFKVVSPAAVAVMNAQEMFAPDEFFANP
jgi:hypothetical protein